MKKIFLSLMAAFLVACASPNLSPNGAIAAAYSSVEVVVDQATTAVLRGRISPEQGEKIKAKSVKARATIKEAEDALKLCGLDIKNCDSVQKILDRVQPMLIEMERELQKKEKS